MEIAVCPNCKKEISENTTFCDHCSNPVVKVVYKHIFSWQWSDKLFLFFSLMIVVLFFQPWFPGSMIDQTDPLSAYDMLINLGDLDIDFLESFDILRMAFIVIIFSLLLYLMTYLRRNLQKSNFLPLAMLLILGFSIVPFLFARTGTGFGTTLSLILFVVVFFYYQRAGKSGRLIFSAYVLLLLFISLSVFLYQLDLCRQYYLKLDAVSFADTYGFWISWFIYGFCLLTVIFRFLKTVEDFWLMTAGLVLSVIAYQTLVSPLFLSGPFAFFADNFKAVGAQTAAHLHIVSIALVIAVFIGVPVGIYITRHPTAADIVLYIAGIIITIPSIALFGFMMPILSSIDHAVDSVSGIGIGVVPAVIALALYSLLPIIRNTYIALNNVDPATIEAGRGMGMTGFQLLIKLQLPLAAPIIMAGVRTAVVMSIAIAAIAAYIGAGGLGLFVSQGLQMSTNDSVIAGAVGMSLLAIVADMVLAGVEEWITPTGLKIAR